MEVSMRPASMPTHKVALASILDLPNELLLKIFTSAAETATTDVNPAVEGVRDTSYYIVRFAKTCRYWHTCIMNHGAFWSTICVIETLETSTASIERNIERTKTCLQRSKLCPLTIYISIQSHNQHAGEENGFSDNISAFRSQLKELSKALRPYADRIVSFDLIVDEYHSTACILCALVGVPMPLLNKWVAVNTFEEMFALEDTDPEDEELFSHPIFAQSDTKLVSEESLHPELRVVSLNSIPLSWSQFSLRKLTTLEITMLPDAWRPSAFTLGEILRTSADSLESITLLAALSSEKSCIRQTIMMPRLHSMVLGFVNTSELIPFLNGIEVPNLKMLVLNDIRRRILHPTDRFIDNGFDHGIVNLFNVMIRRFPIGQLQNLILRHIAFCPSRRTLGNLPTSEILAHLAAGAETAAKFFCSLESLQLLTLCGPDQVTLEALNGVQVFNDGTLPKFLTPRMTDLSLFEIGFYMLATFLWTRLNSQRAFIALTTFTIAVPNDWFLKFPWWSMVVTSDVAKTIVCRTSNLPAELEAQLRHH
ncbi:hypothetical protein C0991_000705 [Blastosporella zonata]|nr:hypothetical protein C0991_000705 [Blastosporella zonata]